MDKERASEATKKKKTRSAGFIHIGEIIPGILKDIEKKHRAFSTGSQFSEWSYRNCQSCKKGFKDRPDRNPFRCEWERALCIACCSDGQVTEEVAKAIGYLDNKGCYIWECPGWVRR